MTAVATDTNTMTGSEARGNEADAKLRAAGFAIAPRLYHNGHPMLDIGYANMRAEARDFDALQPVVPLCDGIVDAVGAEARIDVPVNLADIRMAVDGTICHGAPMSDGIPPILAMEEQGFAGLAARMTTFNGGANGAAYLSSISPERRARNVNESAEEIARLAKGGAKAAVLRTRIDADGSRKVYAAVGPHFDDAIDADTIASIAREAMDGLGLRGEASYDGARVLIEGFAHTPVDVDEMGVGEPFRAGVRLTSADDGTAALVIDSLALRIRCVNATVSTDKLRTRILHKAVKAMGRDERRAKVREAIVKALDINPFIKAWSDAARDTIMDGAADPAEAIKALVSRGFVKTPAGSNRDTLTARILAAWNLEPVRTRAGIVNAITRAAHTNRWASPWARASIEEDAGRLIYVRNLTLN